MKQYKLGFFLLIILCTALCAACAGQQKPKVIFIPPDQDILQDQTTMSETWEVVESQNGPGETGLPEWVRRYFSRELRELESRDLYTDAYLFVGRNRGNNFTALQQWANNFNAGYDLPNLIARRVERRLIASATLYPDDEYGDYFGSLIKKVSDNEYSGTLEEPIFWVKRKMIVSDDENADTEVERYEFLALISINKETLQKQLRETMTEVKTKAPPTRDQAAAINRVQQSFFEGF